MNKKSHVWLGVLTGAYLAVLGFPIGHALLGSVAGQVLPDVDTLKGHRKYLHNVWVPILLALTGEMLLLMVALSWLIHMLVDGMTKGTMQPLWPLFKFKHSGFVKNGSAWEKVFVLVATLVIVVMGAKFLQW